MLANFKFEKYIEIAKCLIDSPKSPKKHFSFIVHKNTIKSIGFNYVKKTHPMAVKFGYPYPLVHSELDAILKFSGSIKDLERYTLINVRLDKKGKVMMSRPCKFCSKLLDSFSFKRVFFTTSTGCFAEMNHFT